MWLINGTGEGPTLVVTAGVHAAEYASIAAALELGRSLDPARLSGRVIVVPVVDMPAFTARSIYVCPLDGKNPNRVFPGNAHGTASEQIARLAVQQRHHAGHVLCGLAWRRFDRSAGSVHDLLPLRRQPCRRNVAGDGQDLRDSFSGGQRGSGVDGVGSLGRGHSVDPD